MKKLFRDNLHYFLIGIVLASLLVCFGISIKCKPKQSERIYYYICASSVDTSSLVKESKDASDEIIREVKVNHESLKQSENSRLFGMVYSLCDIYIYPESQLERTIPLSMHFAKDELISLIPNSTNKEMIYDEEKCCAIKVYDAVNNTSYLTDFINFSLENSQNYYVSFYKSSLHIGQSSSSAAKIVNHLFDI